MTLNYKIDKNAVCVLLCSISKLMSIKELETNELNLVKETIVIKIFCLANISMRKSDNRLKRVMIMILSEFFSLLKESPYSVFEELVKTVSEIEDNKYFDIELLVTQIFKNIYVPQDLLNRYYTIKLVNTLMESSNSESFISIIMAFRETINVKFFFFVSIILFSLIVF